MRTWEARDYFERALADQRTMARMRKSLEDQRLRIQELEDERNLGGEFVRLIKEIVE